MATFLRATVMLAVLVGLPAAWVYYGPLPPAAMGVIQRTVASAKHSLGWEDQTSTVAWQDQRPKTAPRFDSSMTQAVETLQQQSVVEQQALPLPPVTQDSQFALASAQVPTTLPATQATPHAELAQQLEPHLSLLRSLDAADYTLENWGGTGQLYRFRCSISLGESSDHSRHFEAIDADPLRAVHQVVGEVTSWQNARRVIPSPRWH